MVCDLITPTLSTYFNKKMSVNKKLLSLEHHVVMVVGLKIRLRVR